MNLRQAATRPREPQARAGLGLFVFYTALTLLLCLWRGGWNLPLTSDNQHYFFIAERAASGVPPHISQFDPKHELSGLLAAAAMRVARPLGIEDVLAARALSLAVASSTVGLASALARVSAGPVAGHIAAWLMIGAPGFLLQGAMGCRPKVFVAFFTLAAAWALHRRRPSAAGAAAACAFLSWQPALLFVGAVFASLAFPRDDNRPKALFAALLGAAVPIALYHLYFLANGAFGVMWEQAYLFPARYPSGRESINPAGGLKWLFRFADREGGIHVIGRLFVAAMVGGWLVALRRPSKALTQLREDPAVAFLVIGGHAAFLFTLFDFQGYPDSFFLLPFMATWTAIGVGTFVLWLGVRTATAARVAALGLSLAAVGLAADGGALKPFGLSRTLNDQIRVAQRVGGFLSQGYSVYAVGCTHLLGINHVSNFVPYGYFFRRINHYVIAKAKRETGRPFYRPKRDGKMPDVILVSRWFIPGGYTWLRDAYDEVTTREFDEEGVRVWVR